MAKFNKKKSNAPKSRKELRKAQRKEKKQQKFESYVNRNKPGKYVKEPIEKNDNNCQETQTRKTKPIKKKSDTVDLQAKQVKAEHDAHKKLQKDMARQRKKLLKVANLDEDRNIKQLEKQLKLNKRKSKNISKAFSSDGLDCILFLKFVQDIGTNIFQIFFNIYLDLLEICEPENMKSIAAAEQQFADLNNEFEDDFALVTGSDSKNKEKQDSSDDLLDDEFESDYSKENTDDENSEFKDSESDESRDSMDNTMKTDKNNGKRKVSSDEGFNNTNKKIKSNKIDENSEESENLSDDEFGSDNSEDSDSENDDRTDQKELWEDIYGRTRNKKGDVITDVSEKEFENRMNIFRINKNFIIFQKSENKYVPPALRGLNENKGSVDQKQAEKLLRLKKLLKGLFL